MAYRELVENEAQLMFWTTPQKWKTDPDADRFYGFAPRNKYFVNGAMVSEDLPGFSAVSRTPFPEQRVPRRGLKAVTSDDPDYSRLCREQGLEHLLSGSSSPSLPNGYQYSPVSGVSGQHGFEVQGASVLPVVNGDGQHQLVSPATSLPGTTTNGHSGVEGNKSENVAE